MGLVPNVPRVEPDSLAPSRELSFNAGVGRLGGGRLPLVNWSAVKALHVVVGIFT